MKINEIYKTPPDGLTIKPRIIWSLLDMLKQYSAVFSSVMVKLFDTELSSYADSMDKEKSVVIYSDGLADLEKVLAVAARMSEELGLDSAHIQAIRMQKRIAGEGYFPADLYRAVSDLRSRIEDQLKGRFFYFVESGKVKYYESSYPFGEAVFNHFPAANDDIADAGKCLAFALNTSAVMHLMRVMECGLKGLAKNLKIPYAPSWESYLTQIQANIATKHNKKPRGWIKDEKFYRDVSGDLLTIKQAWRNPTMHIDRRYSAEEAELIYNSVGALMARFAARFNEHGKRVSSSKI